MRRFFCTVILLILIACPAIAAHPALAQIYSEADVAGDAVRLRNAVHKLYALGIKPVLTPGEIRALGDFEFDFPLSKDGDDILDFSATTDGRYLQMPVMSLKALEDLATAYAWLTENRKSLGTIDLYFAMLRYRDPSAFAGGRHPKPLDALGVPADAYKTSKTVDDISLRLRNEAFAFIMAHELGHIRFRHRPVNELTARQARADEVEADRFALDIFARTGTGVLGPILYFQAQVYRLVHRHEYASDAQWRDYVKSAMTHPVSLERIKEMIGFIEGPLIRARPGEVRFWRQTATMLQGIAHTLEDIDLGRCIVRVAKAADPAILKPRAGAEAAEIMRRCRGL
jgi:hypothetical protein